MSSNVHFIVGQSGPPNRLHATRSKLPILFYKDNVFSCRLTYLRLLSNALLRAPVGIAH